MSFKGSDYEPGRDGARLHGQHLRVRNAVLDRGWFTFAQVAEETGDPPGSVERQVRYLRDKNFGGFLVQKKYLAKGLWAYRVMPPNGLATTRKFAHHDHDLKCEECCRIWNRGYKFAAARGRVA